MSGKYNLAIEEEHLQHLKNVQIPHNPEGLLHLAVEVLAGNTTDEGIRIVSEQCGLGEGDCISYSRAAGSIFWEFAKSGTSNPATISAVLVQLGLEKTFSDKFAEVYQANRRVLASLKNSMTISFMQYKKFSWRLDVELGRRNIHTMTSPKFLLRLDLENSGSSSLNAAQSVHIQSDFANLKRLQAELQSAVDEISSVHSQRISRYIT